MKMLQLPEEDMALLTGDKAAARIHVTFMGAALQPEKLAERMRAAGVKHIVGFRPTGGRCRWLVSAVRGCGRGGACQDASSRAVAPDQQTAQVLRVHACVPISRMHSVASHSF